MAEEFPYRDKLWEVFRVDSFTDTTIVSQRGEKSDSIRKPYEVPCNDFYLPFQVNREIVQYRAVCVDDL